MDALNWGLLNYLGFDCQITFGVVEKLDQTELMSVNRIIDIQQAAIDDLEIGESSVFTNHWSTSSTYKLYKGLTYSIIDQYIIMAMT